MKRYFFLTLFALMAASLGIAAQAQTPPTGEEFTYTEHNLDYATHTLRYQNGKTVSVAVYENGDNVVVDFSLNTNRKEGKGTDNYWDWILLGAKASTSGRGYTNLMNHDSLTWTKTSGGGFSVTTKSGTHTLTKR